MDGGTSFFWVVFSIVLGILYYRFLISSFRTKVTQELSKVWGRLEILPTGTRHTIWMVLSLILGTIAQITFLVTVQDKQWNTRSNLILIPGLLLYALAGILFIRGVRQIQDMPLPVPIQNYPQRKPKFGFWFTSVGLAGAIAIHAMYAAWNEPKGYAFAALWILSILLFVISVLADAGWQPPSTQVILDWFKIHRTELFVIATIIVLSFFIRFLDLEAHPYSFDNDEGEMGLSGVCILRGECTNWFVIGWAAQPRIAFIPDAISIAIFGNTALAVRLVSVIIGTISTLAVYLFAREVFTRKIAWISAVMLATLPVHVHFSRQGVDNIADSLSAPLLLWLFFRGIKRGSRLSFLAAGIVAGFCIYTYPGSLLAPAFVMGLLLYFTLKTRGFLRAHIRNILIFILMATVIVIPIVANYYTNSDMFLARLKTESIFQNGAIQYEMNNTGQSMAGIIIGRFLKSSLVFIATPAPSGFYFSPKPYLTPLAALLFMLGLTYIIWRIKNPLYMTLFIWFWIPVILGSTFTGGPPTSQRMLMSMPAVVIITAIGMTKIIAVIQQSGKTIARLGPILLLIVVLYIGYKDIRFYFYEYRIGHFYEDPINELSYETRIDIAPLHSQGRLYMIENRDIPFVVFPNLRFFAPDVEKFNFDPVSRETLAAIPHDKDVLFIAPSYRKSDLELIKKWIPGGIWNEVKRRYQPAQTLYFSYKVTKEQLEGLRP